MRGADEQITDRLDVSALIQAGDVCTHCLERVQNAGARWIDADIPNQNLAVRDNQSCDKEIRRGGDVARNCDVCRSQIVRRCQGDGRTLTLDVRTQTAQHALGMVAGRSRFNYCGLAVGVQTGEQDRRFELCGGDRHLIADAVEFCRGYRQRTEVSVLALNVRAHLRERFDDATHRPLLNRGVSVQRTGKRLTGKDTAQQAGGCAGVAGVQQLARRGQSVQTDAADNDLVIGDRDVYAHFPKTGDGGQAILTHQKSGDAGRSAGQRTEHNRTVGDGFVARYRDSAAQTGDRGNQISHFR